MLEKANQGFYPSGAPLGYISVEKTTNGEKAKVIDIDELRAPIIQKMFRLYAPALFQFKR